MIETLMGKTASWGFGSRQSQCSVGSLQLTFPGVDVRLITWKSYMLQFLYTGCVVDFRPQPNLGLENMPPVEKNAISGDL